MLPCGVGGHLGFMHERGFLNKKVKPENTLALLNVGGKWYYTHFLTKSEKVTFDLAAILKIGK